MSAVTVPETVVIALRVEIEVVALPAEAALIVAEVLAFVSVSEAEVVEVLTVVVVEGVVEVEVSVVAAVVQLLSSLSVQEERAERLSCRSFFHSLSELRGKERSLLFGDFVLLSNSSSSLAYLRIWDQSKRYLAAFNWAEEVTVLQLSDTALPRQATVVLSTNSSVLPVDSSVDLTNLQLGPGQAALLMFAYTG